VEKIIVKPDKNGSEEYITQYEYDANGNIEKVIDPNHKATVLIYDEVNRLEERSLPIGIKTVYTYRPKPRVRVMRRKLKGRYFCQPLFRAKLISNTNSNFAFFVSF